MGAPEPMANLVRTRIMRGLQDLPALSDVVTKTLEATERDSTTAAEIERLVASDAALSAKILRVVNSAYYGLSGQVFSLAQAVVILGMQQIRNLVLSISALSLLKGRTPELREMQQGLWLHSFATAACANAIGRRKRFGARDTELAFTAGLLHDIGKLFLFSNFPDEYARVLECSKSTGCSITEAEATVLGVGHEEVGLELARAWRFPLQLSLLIGMHERPLEGEPSPPLLAVHAADHLTEDFYYGADDPVIRPMDPQVFEWLAFDELQLDGLREETMQRVDEIAEVYGLVLDRE